MAVLEQKMISHQKSKGFTLVELLIVMTILVAMVSIAAPYARNSNKGTLALNEALNIKELIYYAMNKSRSSNIALRLVHSKTDRSYWLEKSELQDQYEFEELENSFSTAHYYDKAIQSISIANAEELNKLEFITFDPRKELSTNISIRLETLDCWAKLTISKRNIELSNGNY